MNKRVALAVLAVAVVALAAMVVPSGAFASGGSGSSSGSFNAKEYKKTHGYLPLKGVDTLQQAKAHAAEEAAKGNTPGRSTTLAPSTLRTPTHGASWKGVASSGVSPPDPNGAIGPNSYVEVVNQKMGIYSRTGSLITSATLRTLTGHLQDSDPMVLWDPDTQRFYYNVLNVANATMDFGFSKDSNPNSIPGSWCRYIASYGYSSSSVPDYPKLGQTKDFVLVGVNFYPSLSSQASTSSDILWLTKPQGSAPISTCPAANTFGIGKITGLLNQDGTQAFTPVPAIQTDPSSTGYIVSMADIECPPNCGTGTKITVFTVTNNSGTPAISAPDSITVGSYTNPADAKQPGTTNVLDTLDGRLTHAVSGFDPRLNTTTVWTAHTILAGAGAGVRWYEIDPGSGTIAQTGLVSNANNYRFNAGISDDRTCTATQCAHGDSMVLGFTVSSSSINPKVAMVSKIGANAVSGVVTLHQSSTFDNGFTCSPCRWGDYGGATPDPAASLTALHGEVWLTNQFTTGGSSGSSGDATWNWEASP
ncbi:MAG TPA: hypothetical protein VF972_05430 [Actinomycetota bacterium]